MKFIIKWQTVISPVRPFYQGEIEVYAFTQEDAIKKAIRQVCDTNAFSPGEIEIKEVLGEVKF